MQEDGLVFTGKPTARAQVPDTRGSGVEVVVVVVVDRGMMLTSWVPLRAMPNRAQLEWVAASAPCLGRCHSW